MSNALELKLVNIINSAQEMGDVLTEVKVAIKDAAVELGISTSDFTLPTQEVIHLISLCVLRNLPDVAIYLLDKGADPDLSRNWDGKTALHFSSDLRNLEFIEILSLYNADFNVKDNKGMTPLHLISSQDILLPDHLESTKLLIKYGADINSIDKNNNSIFHTAVENCHYDIVKILLDNNVNQDLTDGDGNTALQNLENLEHEDKEKTLQILKDHAQKILSKKITSESEINNKQKNRIKTHMRNRPKIGGFRNG